MSLDDWGVAADEFELHQWIVFSQMAFTDLFPV